MDFDNRKVYGDTSITDGLVILGGVFDARNTTGKSPITTTAVTTPSPTSKFQLNSC